MRILLSLFLLFSAASFAADPPPGDRVVCVSKQLNEFIYAVGAERILVARDLTSVTPPAILALPNVGYHRALSAEGIVSMRPSIVLTDGNVGPDAVLDRVKEVGIPIVTMKPGEGEEAAQALMLRLGAYLGHETQAAKIVADWKRNMQEAITQAAAKSGSKKPRVLIMHFGQIGNSYLGLSKGGVGDQMLQWAGAENALDKVGGMTRLTPGIIAQAAPDVIIATDVGFDRLGSAEKFKELPGIALTPAGASGRIYRIDEGDVMYFAPRTPDALRRLSAILHP